MNSLATLLGVPETSAAPDERCAAIVSTRDGQVAIVVDRFVSEIDVIVKPLSEGLNRIRAFQGASILGDGTVALVMDPTQIVLGARVAERQPPKGRLERPPVVTSAQP